MALGPSAASHVAGARYKNPQGLQSYAAAVAAGRWPLLPPEPSDPYREMRTAVTLALRLTEGLAIEQFERRFGVNPVTYYGDELTRLAELGLVQLSDDAIRLTAEGLWLSDEVFSALI